MTAAVLLFSMGIANAQKAVQLIHQTSTDSPILSSSPTNNILHQGDMDWTTYSGDDSCNQETPSNDFENGWGNLHLLTFANDYTLDAGESFTLDSLSFNVLVEIGMSVNSADIHFYEDSGNGPGEEITSMSLSAVTPFSSENIGEAFDLDVLNMVFHLDDPVELTGSGIETTYWVGIQIAYDGESSYMETTTIINTSNEMYYYDADSEAWIPSSATEADGGMGAANDGVINFYGECSDLDACTGQPDAGEIEGDGTFGICSGNAFNLNVTSADIAASAIIVQWQEHDPNDSDNDTWTDIDGENTLFLNMPDGITEDTDFRLYVECQESGLSDTTDPVSVTINSSEECYCTPIYSTGCTLGDRISNVSLTGESEVLDNDSQCSDNAYGDYTEDDSLGKPDLAPGETYTLSVSTDYTSPTFEQVRAWIDYNKDGQFTDDEEIANTNGNGLVGGTQTFDFTVAEGLDADNYRMRVRLVYSGTDIDPCDSQTYGETEDYTVEIIQLEGCQGTPVAGTIDDDDFSICAGNAFSISVSGASDPADGLTRIWQSSPEGEDDWTDIDGASSNTYTAENGIDEPSDFRYKVTCTNNDETDISGIITITLNPGDECYCTPIYTTGCIYGDQITNVSLPGESEVLNNDSQCSDNSYGDYTEDDDISKPNLAPGETYTLSVSTDYGNPDFEQARAWIDFNGDGQFTDDEDIANTNGNGLIGGTQTFDFTLSEDLDAGDYRMRVRLVMSSTSSDFDACESQTYGETEDYTVEIIQLDDCEGTPTAGTPDDDFSVCAGNTFSVSVSGASDPANGLERIWQSSPEGEDVWTAIDGATSTTYVVENGIDDPTDYRYHVTCTNSTETDISDVVTVTLNPALECYCIPTNSFSESYYISNFSSDGALVDVNNTSGFSDGGYADYTETDTIKVYAGQEFDVSISSGNTYTYSYEVWLDLNQNGNFEDDGENILSSGFLSSIYTGTYTMPSTLANGSYRLRIRNGYIGTPEACGDFDYGEAEDYIVKVIDEPSCLPPSDIVVTEINSTSAQVDWTASNDETEWEVVYGETGFDIENAGTSITVDDGNPQTDLTNLDSNTGYDIYVRAICDGNVESLFYGPAYFITSCVATDVPFTQDFEDATPPDLPNCGSIETLAGNDWETANETSYGFDSNVLKYSYSVNSAADSWYFTQGINLEAGVNYQITYTYGNNSFYNSEKLKVSYGTSASASAMTTELANHPEITDAQAVTNTVIFTAVSDDTYYFGFNAYSDIIEYFLYVDDIEIDYGPTCPIVSNIDFENITDTSVKVIWTPGGNDTAWEVIYGETGFNPETGGESVNVDTGTPETTLTGLDPEIEYDVYVRAICGENNESDLAGPESFSTGITPPENNYLCDAIALIANDGCSGGPYTNAGAFSEPDEPRGSCLNEYHGTNTVWFSFEAPNNGEATVTADFPETEFDTEMVIFEAPTDCADMNTLGDEVGCVFSGTFELELSDLNPGDIYYVKVGGFNGTEGNFCIEVQTDAEPPCPAPTDIVVNTEDITDSSADVSWTPSGSETQWKVIYGETGFDLDANEGTSIVVNNTPETTITNLDPDTTYDVYVVAICDTDTGNSSEATGPETFTTTELSVNNHLFESFTFYPNPVNNELTLKAGNQIEQIEVYNLLGQNVMSSTPNKLQTQLNTERLQSGVYLMKVTIDGSTKTFRVIKK